MRDNQARPASKMDPILLLYLLGLQIAEEGMREARKDLSKIDSNRLQDCCNAIKTIDGAVRYIQYMGKEQP